MLLRLGNTAKVYGGRVIFKGVNLTVEAGRITLLAGPNGAGKSTLLKIMAGLISPSAGDVEYGLKDGGHIGYLGHQTFIYPDLSAVENLRFWNRLYGLPADDEILKVTLERVELAPFAHERAGSFSRGMAQRLNLARILLLSPALLLLDEPSTGLDQRSRKLLSAEITAAAKRGAGVVWISHSLDEDLALADHVALLAGTGLSFFESPALYRASLAESAC